MRSFVFAALLAATAGVPAMAQDVASAPFTGLRVEGLLGGDRLQNGGHDDAIMYGVGAGYDLQMGGLLVGVEADITDSDARQCYGVSIGNGICASTGRDIAVGGRVGTVLGGRTLLYAKAGYTNARVKLAVETPSATFTSREELDGIRVGAGAEYALSQNTFLKAEYRYSNYEQGFERHQALGGFGVRF